MLKKYFWAMGVIIPTSLALVFSSWQGWLPFSGWLSFSLGIFLLIGIAFFYPREFFWFFMASLPLENVFLAPDFFPFSLRLYQLNAVVLFSALLLRKFSGKKDPGWGFHFWENIDGKEVFSWLNGAIFSWLVIFSLGSWNNASVGENIKWALIVASFVFLFWLAQNFLQTSREKAEGLFFFLLGGAIVWLAGFYQALAEKMGGESFLVMAERINASFLEPDWLGIYWAFFLGLMLGLKIFFVHWEKGKKLFLGRFNLAFFLARILEIKIFFIGAMLALTVSRSAWLATAGILVGYAFLIWRGTVKENFLLSNFFQGVKEFLLVSAILLASFGAVKIFGFSDFDLLNRASSTISGEQKITVSCREDKNLPEKISEISQLEQWGCRHINLEEISTEKKAGFFVKEIDRPDPNVNIRKEIYKTTWQEIKKHPWLGQGWGASSKLLGQDAQGNGLNASNIFLEIWLSAGVLGLCAFLFVLLLALKTILRMPRAVQGFFLLSGGAFLLANLFNAGIFSGFFWVWLASLSINKKQ